MPSEQCRPAIQRDDPVLPATATREEYIRYANALTATVILGTLAVLLFVFGFVTAYGAVHIQQAGEWFTVDLDGGAMLVGSALQALGITCFSWASMTWQRMQSTLRVAGRPTPGRDPFVAGGSDVK